MSYAEDPDAWFRRPQKTAELCRRYHGIDCCERGCPVQDASCSDAQERRASFMPKLHDDIMRDTREFQDSVANGERVLRKPDDHTKRYDESVKEKAAAYTQTEVEKCYTLGYIRHAIESNIDEMCDPPDNDTMGCLQYSAKQSFIRYKPS